MLSHLPGAHEQRREKRTSAFTKLALKEERVGRMEEGILTLIVCMVTSGKESV
jgi:hypothetical protein